MQSVDCKFQLHQHVMQTEDVPKPQHVPYHKHGRKLHIGLAETSESVARTMNQWQKGVAHAFTFSFKRSKGGQHERVRVLMH